MHVDELDANYPAEVVRLGASIDPVSQTIGVSGRMLGTPAELLPGMSGWVTFPSRKPH